MTSKSGEWEVGSDEWWLRDESGSLSKSMESDGKKFVYCMPNLDFLFHSNPSYYETLIDLIYAIHISF